MTVKSVTQAFAHRKKIVAAVVAVGGFISALVTGVFLLNSQSHLKLALMNVSEKGHEYVFEATGPNPVRLGKVGLDGGQFMFEVKRSVLLTDKQWRDIIDNSYLSIRGSTMPKYAEGLTIFPGKENRQTLVLEPKHDVYDLSFLKIVSIVTKIPYEQTYEGFLTDRFSALAASLGIVTKQRKTCFFACGKSGAEISCELSNQDISEIQQDFCTGPFMAAKACCPKR